MRTHKVVSLNRTSCRWQAACRCRCWCRSQVHTPIDPIDPFVCFADTLAGLSTHLTVRYGGTGAVRVMRYRTALVMKYSGAPSPRLSCLSWLLLLWVCRQWGVRWCGRKTAAAAACRGGLGLAREACQQRQVLAACHHILCYVAIAVAVCIERTVRYHFTWSLFAPCIANQGTRFVRPPPPPPPKHPHTHAHTNSPPPPPPASPSRPLAPPAPPGTSSSWRRATRECSRR